MPNYSLNCNGCLLDLSTPKVMAILNITPDSFYDGGTLSGNQEIIKRIDQFIEEGADIIDVGAMSSRPNAEIVSVEEEWRRLQFTIEYLISHFPDIPVSVDTIHAEIARRALENGCHIINDISAGNYDVNMLSTVGEFEAAFVGMHMRGTPSTMQGLTDYPNGVFLELLEYFKNMVSKATASGIKDVIIDPGFGFAKTLEQNYAILNKLHLLRVLEKPLLVGVSRKSMIYRGLGVESEDALNGTTALNMVALREGAHILRVHDPKECKEVIQLHEFLNRNNEL